MDSIAPAPETPTPPAPPPVPAADPAQGAPPPAAQTVLQGTVKEGDAAELVELRRKLADEERARRAAEVKAAEAEDKLHRTHEAVRPKAKPAAKGAGTFFFR
jgi:hypothetical protein